MPATPRLLRPLLLAALLGSVAVPPASADVAGPYLAARAATVANDYAAGLSYYDRLLVSMPEDRDVQDGALLSHVALADFDRAGALASVMVTQKDPTQIATLVMLAQNAKSGDFAKGIALLDGGADPGALVGGLYRAWALVGEGQMGDAAKAFDAMVQKQGLEGFASYHKALALALVGDYEGAEKIFTGTYAQLLNGTRRGIVAHVQVLSQLERDAEAIRLLDTSFGQILTPSWPRSVPGSRTRRRCPSP